MDYYEHRGKAYPIPDPDLTDEEYVETGGFCERLFETSPDHQDLVVIAPHGGMIEPATDAQAEYMFSRMQELGKEATCWELRGRVPGGGSRKAFHIPSTSILPEHFPFLGSIINRDFTHSVAFHGCKEDYITIGGLASRDFKDEVADVVSEAVGRNISVIEAVSGPYGGASLDNVMNRLSPISIQLEQPEAVRDKYALEVAEAVASVFRDLY